jgi:hypothetical protein
MKPELQQRGNEDRQSRRSRSATRLALGPAIAVLVATIGGSIVTGQQFDGWQAPVSVDPGRLLVNTHVNDGCPIEAADGNTLVFASNRGGDLDIWVAYRADEDAAWAEVERLPASVNRAGTNEFCPTPLPGGRLLFVSNRASNCGGTPNADIYITRQHPVFGWLEPQPLSCDINSVRDEFSPSLFDVNGVTTLYFSSDRDEASEHKIYSSVRQPDGSWSPAAPVHELNMAGASDARPNVRKDGLEIVFDSTRGGGLSQIYTASRTSLDALWSIPEPVTAVNSPTAAQSRASFSRDGSRLYFGSTRANVAGDTGGDIFVSARTKQNGK